MTLNATIGIGITGVAAGLLRVSDPAIIVGLAVMGQAIAWLPVFVTRCLAVLSPQNPPADMVPLSSEELKPELAISSEATISVSLPSGPDTTSAGSPAPKKLKRVKRNEETGDDDVPRAKIKTRPAPPPSDPIPAAPSLPRAIPVQVQRPYFPERASPQEVFDHLASNGFVVERIRGTHYQMKHRLSNIPTTVPLHGDRVKPGTLNSIRHAFYRSQGFE